MPKVTPIYIPDPRTLKELRDSIVLQFDRLSLQITAKQSEDQDMTNHRITNLKDPSALSDAVNLRTLNASIDNLQGSAPRVNKTATAKPNQILISTGNGTNLTLSTTTTDIPGYTLTLPQIGTWLIQGVFDLTNGAGDGTVFANIVENGTVVASPQAALAIPTPGGEATVFQQWMYVTTTASTPIKFQAHKAAGTGASQCKSATTVVTALYVSP